MVGINANIKRNGLINNLDWVSICLYVVLVILGWLNIYAAVYDSNHSSIFDFTQKYGKQIVWIGAAFVIAIVILLIDSKVFTTFSIPIYILTILMLCAVLVFGVKVNGARSWFEIGGVRIQPAEFAKFATNLAVAYIMSKDGFKMMTWRNMITIGVILVLPALLIKLQNDTGSALVYSAFLLVMYREGMHGSILVMLALIAFTFIMTLITDSPLAVLIGISVCTFFFILFYDKMKDVLKVFAPASLLFVILYILLVKVAGYDISAYSILLGVVVLTTIVGLIISYKRRLKHIIFIILGAWICIIASAGVDFTLEKLEPHQRIRIYNTLGLSSDLKVSSYNVNQSKIAIGSGGFSGKGFLQGTQTQLNFVPEQSTDFIFCTVGEEWGFMGCLTVIALQICLILRMIFLAERQRAAFSRIYGYGVAAILFFHFAINIGMTIGLAPVIGIPLPFFSYGGSSLWSFTILLFIFLRFDANRIQVFR